MALGELAASIFSGSRIPPLSLFATITAQPTLVPTPAEGSVANTEGFNKISRFLYCHHLLFPRAETQFGTSFRLSGKQPTESGDIPPQGSGRGEPAVGKRGQSPVTSSFSRREGSYHAQKNPRLEEPGGFVSLPK